MTDPTEFWVHDSDRAGVSPQAIAEWESRHNVRLPQLLKEAFAQQDGGWLRKSAEIEILPLVEMQPANEDWWEWVCYDLPDKIDGYDRSLVFWLGTNEYGGEYLLDYNPNGRQGEPVVIEHYSDPGDADVVAGSVAEFIEARTARSDAPLFDWNETKELDEVIATETVDLSAAYGRGARVEQVLGRWAGDLVLYVHEVAEGEEERFEKTILPEPLDGDWASIEAFRPDPVPTFTLMLQPEDSDGIRNVESVRDDDQGIESWRNECTEGAPVYVQFESADRKKLEELRTKLFGQESAEKAARRDAAQEEMQRQFESLSEPDQQTAGLAMLHQMREQLEQIVSADDIDPADVPPDLAQVGELLQEKVDEAVRQAQEMMAKNPPAPDAARAIEQLLKLQRQVVTGEAETGEAETGEAEIEEE